MKQMKIATVLHVLTRRDKIKGNEKETAAATVALRKINIHNAYLGMCGQFISAWDTTRLKNVHGHFSHRCIV